MNPVEPSVDEAAGEEIQGLDFIADKNLRDLLTTSASCAHGVTIREELSITDCPPNVSISESSPPLYLPKLDILHTESNSLIENDVLEADKRGLSASNADQSLDECGTGEIVFMSSASGNNPHNTPRKNPNKSGSRYVRKFEEMVFDSGSAPLISRDSISRGRRGPLDADTYESMLLVKELGACWRCRLLSKKCDDENPCKTCPREITTDWNAIGCRRGTLKVVLSSIFFWLRCNPNYGSILAEDKDKNITGMSRTAELASSLNKILIERIRRRAEAIGTLGVATQSTKNAVDARFCEIYKIVQIYIRNTSSPVELRCLDCILNILWEYSQSSTSESTLGQDVNLSTLTSLLCSASTYQEQVTSNSLIRLALSCLQSALEALHLVSHENIGTSSHQACAASSCRFNFLSNLDLQLKSYLDALSDVLFKKHSRRCKDWWLSVFYSLCIQSFVRRLLVPLVQFLSYDDDGGGIGAAKNYLYLGVRLFAIISSTYDPLILDLDDTSHLNLLTQHRLQTKHGKLAQVAVQQAQWAEKDIGGSKAYLMYLFEDDGAPLKTTEYTKRQGQPERVVEKPEEKNSAVHYRPETRGRSRWSAHQDESQSNHLVHKQFATPRTPPLNRFLLTEELPPLQRDLGPGITSRLQHIRFSDDLFTPRWIRGYGSEQEGWCGFCQPHGRWLRIENSAYWNDRCLFHGICEETGSVFEKPVRLSELPTRIEQGVMRVEYWKGECHRCSSEVTFGDNSKVYSAWHLHAVNCHQRPITLPMVIETRAGIPEDTEMTERL